MLRGNALRPLLAQDRPIIGAHLPYADPNLVEMAGLWGFDFVFFDGEHFGFQLAQCQQLMPAAEAVGLATIARTSSQQPHELAGLADAGADAVVVTNCASVSQFRAAYDALAFPPRGSRSLSSGTRGAGWGLTQSSADFFADHARHSIACPLLEDYGVFADPARLAAEPNLELAAIGLNDLSASLGLPGQPDHPAVRELLDRALPVWREAGVILKGAAQSVEQAAALLDAGFRVVALPLAPFFGQTMSDHIKKLQDR